MHLKGETVMTNGTRLLLLEGEPHRKAGHLADGLRRSEVLNALKESGVRVQHDSGGRLLVVETTERTEEVLRRRMKGVKIVPLEGDIEESIGDLDPQDALFVRALVLRNSPAYREMKARQKPGETPEEQLLVSGPCTPPED
jgi:hypothetical protein